ncbi:MAG: hypothetical protein E7Z72_02050 [Methanocorpusculum parvum]|nr:hypothetical protein [Methanocorpusculum parvum]
MKPYLFPSRRHSGRKCRKHTPHSISERLYEALWDNTLELRKKAGIMIGILGIILPLLVTVYASNSEGLDSGLFTIFFGTLLMVFLEYFGLYICLYLTPKYGLSWNLKELDEKKLRIFSEEGSEEDREEIWDNLLVEQGAKYTLYFSLSAVLDVILFLTIGVLAVFLLELIAPITSGMSLVTVMLVFSFAFSACVAEAVICAVGYIFSSVYPKMASRFNNIIYLLATAALSMVFWGMWFWNMFS